MRHIAFSESDTYPIALLIKESSFNKTEINLNYIDTLTDAGVPHDDIVAISLKYNDKDKAPVKLIREYLEELLPALDSISTEYVYCADANYFKVLTNSRKAEALMGYVLPCAIKGYEHLKIVLGVNSRSLLYNPANAAKLDRSLQAFTSVIQGNYTDPGQDIIHSAHYPDTLAEIKQALIQLHQYPELSCDIEGFSLRFEQAGIATITFCWSEHEGIAFPCDYQPYEESFVGPIPNGHHGRYVPNPEVRALIKEFLETYQGTLRWHNATYDGKVNIFTLWMKDLLDNEGLLEGLHILNKRLDDTKIIAYLATNSTAGNKLSLKDLAHEFAGNWAMGDDIKDIRKIPLPTLLQYNLVDGLSTNFVYNKYYPIMCADGQLELYRNLMLPSLKTIMQIELTGMPMDPVKVQEVKAELQALRDECLDFFYSQDVVKRVTERLQREAMEKANAKLKTKQHPIEHFASVTFNPNSPQQLQKLLYDEMCLPVLDYTKTKQPATGGDTLEKLINHAKSKHFKQLLQNFIKYSKVQKILTDFIPAFERAIEKGTVVVWLHGNLNLGGTVSGRLSSSDPNMQNIPSGSTYGKLIKKCFTAPFGWIMGGADFNSLEDYVSALTTKDPNKLKVYIEGYDGHCLRAFAYFPERLPGIVDTVESINSIKKDFPEVRQDSKAPTFALTYQGMWITLMNNLGWTEEKSKQVEKDYHELYAVSTQWVKDKLAEASQRGYVEVAFGLRLRTPLLAQTLRGRRSTPFAAEAEGRTAGNALGQSYGLLNNRAANEFMEKVWDSPYRHDIKPIAMIHDALYFIFKDDIDVIEWMNNELIKSMQWQDLPELEHDTVKLGAELSLFWPTWADELVLPNGATQDDIRTLAKDHLKNLKESK